MQGKLAIIIVTHNSEQELKHNISSIEKCRIQYEQLIIVDSGSDSTSYLRSYSLLPGTIVIYEQNIGFCKGNNIGFGKVKKDIDVVLFLNPDVIFSEDIIGELENELERNRVFSISPMLKRCTIEEDKVIFSDEIDTNGIFSTWYSRFYDNKKLTNSIVHEADALCGAFILCKKKALNDILINHREVFNEKLYMYKEDIELGLRARAIGYRCLIREDLIAYHGRGWKERKKVKKWQKILSSRNEFFLLKHMRIQTAIIAAIYYTLKYIYVKFFESIIMRKR